MKKILGMILAMLILVSLPMTVSAEMDKNVADMELSLDLDIEKVSIDYKGTYVESVPLVGSLTKIKEVSEVYVGEYVKSVPLSSKGTNNLYNNLGLDIYCGEYVVAVPQNYNGLDMN